MQLRRPSTFLGMRTGDPEKWLADGEGTLELRDGGIGWESPPEVGVFGTAVGAGGEEQAGLTDGKVVEVGGVCAIRPSAAIEDEGEVVCQGDAHAGAIL